MGVTAALIIGGLSAASAAMGTMAQKGQAEGQNAMNQATQRYNNFRNSMQNDARNRQKIRSLQSELWNNYQLEQMAATEKGRNLSNFRRQMDAQRAATGGQQMSVMSNLESSMGGRGIKGGMADRMMAVQSEAFQAQRVANRQQEKYGESSIDAQFSNRLAQQVYNYYEFDSHLGGEVPTMGTGGMVASGMISAGLQGVAAGYGAYKTYSAPTPPSGGG